MSNINNFSDCHDCNNKPEIAGVRPGVFFAKCCGNGAKANSLHELAFQWNKLQASQTRIEKKGEREDSILFVTEEGNFNINPCPKCNTRPTVNDTRHLASGWDRELEISCPHCREYWVKGGDHTAAEVIDTWNGLVCDTEENPVTALEALGEKPELKVTLNGEPFPGLVAGRDFKVEFSDEAVAIKDPREPKTLNFRDILEAGEKRREETEEALFSVKRALEAIAQGRIVKQMTTDGTTLLTVKIYTDTFDRIKADYDKERGRN